MSYYIAHLVFQIKIDPKENSSFEAQIRLFEACSLAEAYQFAKQAGLNEEFHGAHKEAHSVHWNFMGVADISEVNLQPNGSLLDSKIVEPGQDPEFEPYIRLKISHLEQYIHKLSAA